jgi:hypothetical protein
VRKDEGVLIQGPFAGASVVDGDGDEAAVVMRREMESLEEVLARSPSAFEDQAAFMWRLVDPQRRKKLDEFDRAHGCVVPFVFWQESSEAGGRITLTLEQHGVLAKEFEQNGYRWTKELQDQAVKRFGPSADGL